jgi:predicted nuclease of predicted toxin-antitoxin system
VAVSETMPRADDRTLIKLAHAEKLILLTEDKDFGWLVFVSGAESAGVILVRFPGNSRQSLVQSVVQVVREQKDKLPNSFVVVQPRHIRISRKP